MLKLLNVALAATLLFVAFPAVGDDPANSKASPADIDKLLAEFRQVYHLDKGQIIKRIKPPFPKGRLYDLDRRIPEFKVLSGGTYKEANLNCLVYRERDGKLDEECPFFAYNTKDGASRGYEAGSLLSVISNVNYRDIEDPMHLLLGKSVLGDYVINPDAPTDELVGALGKILKDECGLPIKLELKGGEEQVVRVHGRLKAPFALKFETPIELYAATLQPGKGEKDQGKFSEFLEDVGRFIEPNYRVISEVENPPQEKLSWHRNVRLRFDDKTLREDRDARSVLNHLEEQTGLTFVMESRKSFVITVKKSD